MTPSPAPTSSGRFGGASLSPICSRKSSSRATQRSVRNRIAGFFATYLFVWLPMTTPGLSALRAGPGPGVPAVEPLTVDMARPSILMASSCPGLPSRGLPRADTLPQ